MSKLNAIIFLFCIFSLYSKEIKLEGKTLASGIESFQGLELSSATKITKICFSLSSSEPKDYLLGVFQGANDKTFFDAFPLYMIKEELEPTKLQEIKISSNQKFKYVRYVSPDEKISSISEFEVYGDLQSIEDESDNYYQPTNLPLLIINSENGQMPQGQDKVTKVNIIATIINEGKVDVKQTGTIKIRGNSSARSEKKPYLVNFDEKTTFLDMPCNDKKWTLIPNMYDKSLLRNILGYKMGSIFGLKYNPSCRFVDFILNGNYRGNYMICDKIEVKKDRINIAEMDETCVEEPEISGGYLLEGVGAKFGGDDSFTTAEGITLSFGYPESDDILEVQKEYIINKINEAEAKCYEDNVEDIDLESFVRYFLVEDFSANQDAIFNSFFVYKDRGDNKFYFGPVWDFDLAFDNAMSLYPTNEKKNFAYKFGLSDGTTNKLVDNILSNDIVLKKVKDTWKEMTETVFTKEIMLDFLDEQIKYINESQRLNYIKWDVLKTRQFLEARCRGSFQAEADYLKEYVEKRFDVFGEIVRNATKESIIDGSNIDSEFSFKDGNKPWGNGKNRWGSINLGDDDDEQCEGSQPGPWGGNRHWGNRNNNHSVDDNSWKSWKNNNNFKNNENP